MKLIYRATTYDCHPAKASSRPFQQVREPGTAYNLSYRGVTYRIDPHAKPVESLQPAAYQAIYRGITYVNQTARVEVALLAQGENSAAQVPSPSLLNHQI